jgi:hypothetical protein
MLNFNQFVNESKDHEFYSIEKNDTVNWKGTKYKVKKAGDGVIHLPRKQGNDTLKVNKGQWNQYGGRLIEKAKKEDEK